MRIEFTGTLRRLPLLLGILIVAPAVMAAEMNYKLHDTFGDTGRGRNELSEPVSIAIGTEDDVAVLDRRRNTVVLYDRRGDWQKSLGSPKGEGAVTFRNPSGVSFDEAGRIWVADTGNDRVVALNPNGDLLVTLGRYGIMKGDFRKPEGITVGKHGRIYVADTGNDRVQVFSNTGKVLEVWADKGSRTGRAFEKPTSLAYSTEGDGYLWVAKEGSPVLAKIDMEGYRAGELDLSKLLEGDVKVAALYVDQGFDRIFVCDTAGNRILVVGKGRLISRVNMDPGVQLGGMAVSWGLNIYAIDADGRKVLVYRRD